jgi:hypothetical protein
MVSTPHRKIPCGSAPPDQRVLVAIPTHRDLLNNICFRLTENRIDELPIPLVRIQVNQATNHSICRKNNPWRLNCLSSWGGEPFIKSNFHIFAISNSPYYSLFEKISSFKAAPPCKRKFISKICLQKISPRKIFRL